MGYLVTALAFLIQVVFGIYIFLLVLRFLLYWARVDFTHPISQFVYTLTNPPLRPLHKFIPQWRGIDFATVLLMLLLQMCEIFLRYTLAGY
ncbi:MAG: YggT family protein, partial [Pseudomonadota bacterium]